ncbi:MAG: TIR domain-containing protein [Cetobacterium sp.]
MYYQIFIELVDENEIIKEIDQKKTEEEIIKLYIAPRIENKNILADGRILKANNIKKMTIKNTSESLNKIFNDKMQNYMFNKLIYSQEKEKYERDGGFFTGRPAPVRKNLFSPTIKECFNELKEENLFTYLCEKYRNKEELSFKSNIDDKSNKIFIVHGHDDEMKVKVTRFIERIGLTPIILHEQASKGQTIIEKIDEYTDVKHGIVLYSPCDLGKSKNDSELKERARQNVVFEHGYLIAKLGKNRVTALNKGNIEIPSDIGGIIYITFDNHEGWQMKLGKELKANGLEINLNNLL